MLVCTRPLLQTPRLLKLLHEFVSEMERGLVEDTSSVKMIPSYVTALPTGKEAGLVRGSILHTGRHTALSRAQICQASYN